MTDEFPKNYTLDDIVRVLRENGPMTREGIAGVLGIKRGYYDPTTRTNRPNIRFYDTLRSGIERGLLVERGRPRALDRVVAVFGDDRIKQFPSPDEPKKRDTKAEYAKRKARKALQPRVETTHHHHVELGATVRIVGLRLTDGGVIVEFDNGMRMKELDG